VRIGQHRASGATGRQMRHRRSHRGHHVVAVGRRPRSWRPSPWQSQRPPRAMSRQTIDNRLRLRGGRRRDRTNRLQPAADREISSNAGGASGSGCPTHQRVVGWRSFGAAFRYKGRLYDLALRFAFNDGFENKALADRLMRAPPPRSSPNCASQQSRRATITPQRHPSRAIPSSGTNPRGCIDARRRGE